ncbi:hypothetical protein E4U54_000745 [Claviceps lovelessii]|nr:hypothetical protein E4U54_000745 [Claviceps lovelessii]
MSNGMERRKGSDDDVLTKDSCRNIETMQTISNENMKNDDQMHQDGRARNAAYQLPRALHIKPPPGD